MQKLRPIGLILAALAALPVFASSRPSVGLLLKAQHRAGFWGAVEQGAREAAAEAGVDLLVKGANEVGNTGIQIKLLDSLVNQKLDAIVVTPVDPARIGPALQQYAAKGTKLVVAETALADGAGIPFVGYNQEQLAIQAAEVFAQSFADGDEVTIFRGNASDRIVVLRETVIIERLKRLRPNVRLHLDFFAITDESGSSRSRAELMLAKYPNAKLFISTSSVSTDALLSAILAQPEPTKFKMAGFGSAIDGHTAKAIETGIVAALIAQIPRQIGYRSVLVAAALVRGEKVAEHTDVPHFVVTKDNVNSPDLRVLRSDN